MSEQRDQADRTGQTDHPQHRAGEGEGVRAPSAKDLGHAEQSVFDGRGNEIVVTTTDDEEGRRTQGTGKSSEEAVKNAKEPGDMLGKDFGPAAH